MQYHVVGLLPKTTYLIGEPNPNIWEPNPNIWGLHKFYNTKSCEELVLIQAQHIERLQEKLAAKNTYIRTYG